MEQSDRVEWACKRPMCQSHGSKPKNSSKDAIPALPLGCQVDGLRALRQGFRRGGHESSSKGGEGGGGLGWSDDKGQQWEGGS